ncbi:NAD(P)-binding protein [Roridomyces roridus]|uniref:NAD(P)-binding protein n=1 Tax=Roridomyces roridus TaxID=1738132 RepID=A0AAD7FGI0_9AGAR|nr:NAD(P)-binding protein [Roridomyces roridus]
MGGVLGPMSKPEFEPERDITDLSGKVVIVTGGYSGIGYETVKQLLLKNAKVYLAGRSSDKAATAIQSLEAETKGKAFFLQLDLGDLPSVRKAAENFLEKEEKLDILFNNAGVMNCPTDMLTKQGYDLQFGTNVLGHFFFTELLLPALTKSYEQSKVPARIITTSSAGHQMAPGSGMDVASLKGGPERDAWIKQKGMMASYGLYGGSKIGNIYIANHWAKAHSDVLVSCSAHPGLIRSELSRHSMSFAKYPMHLISWPATRGALPQLWAATAATPAQMNGQYVVPWGVVGQADKRATDETVEKEMIEYMREQLKEY